MRGSEISFTDTTSVYILAGLVFGLILTTYDKIFLQIILLAGAYFFFVTALFGCVALFTKKKLKGWRKTAAYAAISAFVLFLIVSAFDIPKF